MKALRTKISTYAIALLTGVMFATPTMAGSSDFSGIWVAGHAELNVVAIDGTHTENEAGDGTATHLDARSTSGTAGGWAPTAGLEVGFNLPLGDTFFVTVGYADGGGSSAQIAKADDAVGVADVTVHASSPEWFYIAPSISIFDNSAVYVKLGHARAELEAIGDVTGTPGGIDGKLVGIGTTSIANNGLFIKTEAGAVQYDQFKIVGIGGSSTAIVEGDPLVGYGHVSIGYKF